MGRLFKDLFFYNKMSNNINYELELKKQKIKFFDELIEQFPCEPNFVLVRIWIQDQLPESEYMKRFTNQLYPHKECVESKNPELFKIFDKMMSKGWKSSTPVFQKIYEDSDEDDRNVLWQWINLFLKIVENHIKSTK